MPISCRPERLRPLAGDQADAAGGRVEEHEVARRRPSAGSVCCSRYCAVRPLSIIAAPVSKSIASGSLHDVLRRHHAHLAVAARRVARIGRAVAGLQVRDARAHRLDDAGAFHAERQRQRQRVVQPGAVVDVDVVEAAGLVADADLARRRVADRAGRPGASFSGPPWRSIRTVGLSWTSSWSPRKSGSRYRASTRQRRRCLARMKRLLSAPNLALATLWADLLDARRRADAACSAPTRAASPARCRPTRPCPSSGSQDDASRARAQRCSHQLRHPPPRHWACPACREQHRRAVRAVLELRRGDAGLSAPARFPRSRRTCRGRRRRRAGCSCR